MLGHLIIIMMFMINIMFRVVIIILIIVVMKVLLPVVTLQCLEQVVPDENVPGKFYLISWGTLVEAMYRAHASEPDNPQVACISNYIQVHDSIGF